MPIWRIFTVLVDCDLGRLDVARERFPEVLKLGYQGLLRHWLTLRVFSRLAEICAALRDADEAANIYPLLQPYARQFVMGDMCLGSASRYLGLLAAVQEAWPQAERHFQVALERNEAIGHRYQLAHTERDYGDMLLRRGSPADVRRAEQHLERAATIYRELGAEPHADRASDRLAESASSSQEARPVVRPAGLTQREVEVLQLIASGKTNAEIADVLVLSVRTVERHITNAYGKIDARGKADATAFVLQHGLNRPA